MPDNNPPNLKPLAEVLNHLVYDCRDDQHSRLYHVVREAADTSRKATKISKDERKNHKKHIQNIIKALVDEKTIAYGVGDDGDLKPIGAEEWRNLDLVEGKSDRKTCNVEFNAVKTKNREIVWADIQVDANKFVRSAYQDGAKKTNEPKKLKADEMQEKCWTEYVRLRVTNSTLTHTSALQILYDSGYGNFKYLQHKMKKPEGERRLRNK